MMKLHAKKLSAFIVAISTCLMFAGCAASEEPATEHTPTHTCVILSNGYNMPVIENASDFIDTPADGDSITIIIADGNPSSNTYNFDVTAKNSAAASKQKKKFLYELSNAISAARPDQAEVDTLAALHYASADIHDLRFANDKKKIVLLCNGLSTTTNLDMTTAAFWTSDQTTLINQIVDAGYISSDSFENVDVTWHFLTATDGQHQQALSPLQERFLTEFWSSYFKAAGAEATIQNEPLSGPAAEDVPPIKAVPVINSDIIIDGAADADNNASIQEQSVVTIPQEKLEFMPNSTDYKSEAQAELVLNDVAGKMLSNCNYLIVGSTAKTTAKIGESTNNETASTLSKNRANKIQEELLNRGFSPEQLTAVGLGSTDSPLRSPMEENNRAVYILDRDSALADEVLSIYNDLCSS